MKALLFCLTVLLVGPLCLAAGKGHKVEKTQACSKNGKKKCPPKTAKNSKKEKVSKKSKTAKSNAKLDRRKFASTPTKPAKPVKTKTVSKPVVTKTKPVPKAEKPEQVDAIENMDEDILESAESEVRDPESQSVEFYQNLPTAIEKE